MNSKELIKQAEKSLVKEFGQIEDIRDFNQEKVLNAFIEQASQKDFRNVLIAFFTFEFIYGWIFSGSTQHIQDGYSTISFIGLYLLARYVRLYQPRISLKSKSFYIASLCIAPICVTAAYITPPY